MPCLMPVGSRSRARRLRGQEPTYLFKDEVPVLVGVEALQVVMQRVAHLLQGHQNRCMSEASHMMPPRSCSSAWLCNMAGHGLHGTKQAETEALGIQTLLQPQVPWHFAAAQAQKVLLGISHTSFHASSNPWACHKVL